MIRRHDAVARRQLKLFFGGAGQALVFVEIESLDFLPRPIGLFQKLDAGFDARVAGKAIDVEVSEQDIEAVIIDNFGKKIFQTHAVQRVVLVVKLLGHVVFRAKANLLNLPDADEIRYPALPIGSPRMKAQRALHEALSKKLPFCLSGRAMINKCFQQLTFYCKQEKVMSSVGYHEPIEALSAETRDMHRAIVSLMEELEAVDWYNQRADACQDAELKAILEHNRDEEKEHAAMVLEWIRRKDARFSKELKDYLFTEKPIAHA